MMPSVANGVFSLAGVVVGGTMGYLTTYWSDRRRERVDRGKRHFTNLDDGALAVLEQYGQGQWLTFLGNQRPEAQAKRCGGNDLSGEIAYRWAMTAARFEGDPANLEEDPLYRDAKAHHYQALIADWERKYRALVVFRNEVIDYVNGLVSKLQERFGDRLPPANYGDHEDGNPKAQYELMACFIYQHLWDPINTGALAIRPNPGATFVVLTGISTHINYAWGSEETIQAVRNGLEGFIQEQDIADLKKTAGALRNEVRALLDHIAAARASRKLPGRCEWV